VPALLEDREAIADLLSVGRRPRIGKKGTELKNPAECFTFPPQLLDGFPHGDETVLYLLQNGSWTSPKIDRLDREAGELDLMWSDTNEKAGHLPSAVVLHTWVRTEIKRLALSDFASRLLDRRGPNAVTEALLRLDLPRFRAGGGPQVGSSGTISTK
jgi:hypothetical protein